MQKSKTTKRYKTTNSALLSNSGNRKERAGERGKRAVLLFFMLLLYGTKSVTTGQHKYQRQKPST